MAEIPTLVHRLPSIERKVHEQLALELERERKLRGVSLRMSELGKCERYLWAAVHQVVEREIPEPRIGMIFRLGDAIEDEVIHLLREAGYRVSGQQDTLRLRISEGMVVDGHRDGLIDGVGRTTELLEIKSAKASRFEELETVGYHAWAPEYFDQLQVYMGASQVFTAVAVVYCKDDSRLYAERIYFDPERFRGLVEKAQRILLSEVPLERPKPANGPGSNFCKFCSAKDWCYSPPPKFDD